MTKDVFLLPLLQPKVAQKLQAALRSLILTKLTFGRPQTHGCAAQTVRAHSKQIASTISLSDNCSLRDAWNDEGLFRDSRTRITVYYPIEALRC